jgi:hypothetical protein
MESYKQSLQVSVSLITPYIPSSISKLNRINFTQPGFTKSFQLTLICFLMMIATILSAVLPAHADQNFSESALPEITHAKKKINRDEWMKGRILVMPRAGLPAKAFTGILKEFNGEARKIGQSGLYIVDLPEYSEEGAVTKLKHHPHLKFAELDRIVTPAFVPNDPYYNVAGNAWHLPKIGAPAAWDITQGAGITIAILDTGVDSIHPDLASNIVPGWNFYNNNSDTSPVHGHGTAVAGSAAAITHNEIGVASVAGKAKIMPLRVSTNDGGFSTDSVIVQSLIYAADHGARVANISYGSMTSSPAIRSAAQYMKDKNGLVVVGAGNTSNLESYSATTAMIPVAATDESDAKASFSSYGDFVALSAPGKSIYTTWSGNQYWSVAGTSFSSPIVAGVIALMMAANPSLSSAEIENLLFSTAVDLGITGRDPYFGYGRVDAAKAVQTAKLTAPTQDTEIPTVSIDDPLEGSVVNDLVPIDVQASDNVGATRAELWINNTSVAVDNSSPFAFTWDSSGTQNGTANLMVRVYDAANNMASSTIKVNVDNPVQMPVADTYPPVVQIINPVAGKVSGNVSINVNASDNNGASGISLWIYIDGSLKASGSGSTMSINWNTRKNVKAGTHTIRVVAKDTTGNTSAASINVNVVR